MDRGRKETQKTDQGNVRSPEGILEEQKKEQIGILKTLLITIKHFFGDFSPSFLPYSRSS